MPKISTIGTNKLIVKYIIKVLVSSIISVFVFSMIIAELFYKFDIDLRFSKITGVIICCLSSAIISYISVKGLKNNGFVMGMLSQIPLLFYTIIDLIFYYKSPVIFVIKLILIILIGGLMGDFASKNSKKFKVK